MKLRRVPPEKVGLGFVDRKCMRRIVVAFDDETFDAIRSRAVEQQTSFAEQVRQLVEWGLEDIAREPGT